MNMSHNKEQEATRSEVSYLSLSITWNNDKTIMQYIIQAQVTYNLTYCIKCNGEGVWLIISHNKEQTETISEVS